MSNMSYCRFQNTARDFDDCHDALEEALGGPCEDTGHELSPEELAACAELVSRAASMVQLVGEALAIDVNLDRLFDNPRGLARVLHEAMRGDA